MSCTSPPLSPQLPIFNATRPLCLDSVFFITRANFKLVFLVAKFTRIAVYFNASSPSIKSFFLSTDPILVHIDFVFFIEGANRDEMHGGDVNKGGVDGREGNSGRSSSSTTGVL